MWPTHRSLTPRTASVNLIRELDIAAMDMPVDGLTLCEILPFACLIDEDGIEWVAVRIAVICASMSTVLETPGWAPRFILDSLPALRELAWQAPDDVSSLTEAAPWMQAAPIRHPSPRTIQSIRPVDGVRLLHSWRTGRHPVMTTLAYFLRARHLVSQQNDECVQRGCECLQAVRIGPSERRWIIEALEVLVAELGDQTRWPELPDPLDEP